MKALSVPLFALAAASPLAFVVLGSLWGGVWVWIALAYMAGALVVLDVCLPMAAENAGDDAFPVADAVLVVLALGALVVLPLVVWTVAGGPGLDLDLDLGLGARVGLFLAAGLWFGQVAHPTAHELIHRNGRGMVWLGMAVYAALIFGHHASAHKLVHHRFVASGGDPNSARAGEGYYRFLARAWLGSLRAGWRAERDLRQGKAGNPYWAYVGGAVLALASGYALAGWPGVLVWGGLGFHFGTQVLLSDYVQHYGLQRRPAASGRLEPVSGRHSWNTPHLFTSAMMLNAPRHSDHHMHPTRPYPALNLDETLPMLPWPLPLACLVALCPPYWHRRMRHLLAAQSLAKA